MSIATELVPHFSNIEHIFTEQLGYDVVSIRSFSVFSDGTLAISLSASDNFQDKIPNENRCKQYFYDSIFGTDIDEIYRSIYSIPPRAQRELTVLANQLSSIAEMADKLQDVRTQMLIGPVLATREDLKKYLMGLKT